MRTKAIAAETCFFQYGALPTYGAVPMIKEKAKFTYVASLIIYSLTNVREQIFPKAGCKFALCSDMPVGQLVLMAATRGPHSVVMQRSFQIACIHSNECYCSNVTDV